MFHVVRLTTSLSGRVDNDVSSDDRMTGRSSPSSSSTSSSSSSWLSWLRRLMRLSREAIISEWSRTTLLLPSCWYVPMDTSDVLAPVTATYLSITSTTHSQHTHLLLSHSPLLTYSRLSSVSCRNNISRLCTGRTPTFVSSNKTVKALEELKALTTTVENRRLDSVI